MSPLSPQISRLSKLVFFWILPRVMFARILIIQEEFGEVPLALGPELHLHCKNLTFAKHLD